MKLINLYPLNRKNDINMPGKMKMKHHLREKKYALMIVIPKRQSTKPTIVPYKIAKRIFSLEVFKDTTYDVFVNKKKKIHATTKMKDNEVKSCIEL